VFNRLVFWLYYGVFRALARVWKPTPRKLRAKEIRSLLVFSAAGIGDTLTDSVAIRALKETFPKARVVVVTHRRRAALARHNPYADEVVAYHKSFWHFFTLVRHLRARKPDAVVMLRGNDPDLWPMAWCVNRRAVVSCPVMTRFGFLVAYPVDIPDWDRLHGVEQTLQITRTLGADTKDKRLVYETREVERFQMRERLEKHGLRPEDPIVVFQVGGGRRSSWRDWPVEHYVELGRELLRRYRARLVLTGGIEHCEKAARIQASLPPGVSNFTGQVRLEEMAALLASAKILVSTDTGIMHLGFAVGVDTLALIHCNNPAGRVGPYGYADRHLVAQLEPPKGVAVSTQVPMSLLRPAEVWAKLEELCKRHRIPAAGSGAPPARR
jgi:ADP-heptose:LPS heptosyltransferase